MKLFGLTITRGCDHDWGKYSKPVNAIMCKDDNAIGFYSVTQMRICNSCGIAEYNKLPQMRSVEDLKNEM